MFQSGGKKGLKKYRMVNPYILDGTNKTISQNFITADNSDDAAVMLWQGFANEYSQKRLPQYFITIEEIENDSKNGDEQSGGCVGDLYHYKITETIDDDVIQSKVLPFTLENKAFEQVFKNQLKTFIDTFTDDKNQKGGGILTQKMSQKEVDHVRKSFRKHKKKKSNASMSDYNYGDSFDSIEDEINSKIPDDEDYDRFVEKDTFGDAIESMIKSKKKYSSTDYNDNLLLYYYTPLYSKIWNYMPVLSLSRPLYMVYDSLLPISFGNGKNIILSI